MKIDPNAPAYPVDVPPSREQIAGAGWIDVPGFRSPGMTIRAAMAKQMYAALLVGESPVCSSLDPLVVERERAAYAAELAACAVRHADALIDALNEEKP